MLKVRHWEVMEVGETFGPIEVEVTDALVKDYVYSCDDFDTAYLHGSDRIAPPLLLCREARDVIRTGYDLASGGAGMHTKHSCQIHACAAIGERVTVTGEHVDKFVKHEKQYIVLESRVNGADGRLLLVQRSTHLRGLKPGVKKIVAPSPMPLPIEGGTKPGDTVVQGAALQSLSKRLSHEQLTVFAGSDWLNIHNSREVARTAGLKGCVASGLQSLAFVSELMARYCGSGWREGGCLDVAFTAPLFADEPVHAGARVLDVVREGARKKLLTEVWCVTQTGVRVLTGRASGWIT